jgi:hypothetical protein
MVCDVRSQGKPSARRSAQKSVEALDHEFQTQGAKAPLVMGSIHGLLIEGEWHKKPTQKTVSETADPLELSLARDVTETNAPDRKGTAMSETTKRRLEHGFWELDGGIEASSIQGLLHLDQWEVGQIDLSPEAQYDLLQILYARRGALYQATTLDMDGHHAPDWVATDPTIRQRRQITTVEGSIVTDPS